MSSEEDRYKEVQDYIRGQVMKYATDLMAHFPVEGKEEGIFGRLAEDFTNAHRQAVEFREEMQTEEGQARLAGVQARLVQFVRDYPKTHPQPEKTGKWAEDAKLKPRSRSSMREKPGTGETPPGR